MTASTNETQRFLAWQQELDQSLIRGASPHASNVLHQLKQVSKARSSSNPQRDTRLAALEEIVPAYLSLVKSIPQVSPLPSEATLSPLVDKLNAYLDLLEGQAGRTFISQSDFKTSVIPDFFLRVFASLIQARALPLSVVGQREIPIRLSFDPKRKGFLVPHLQRVDMAIVLFAELSVNKVEHEGFCIPLFAAESKTYFDKNMISGVDFSVRTLKSTFPDCVYLAIGERSDFDLKGVNYANSAIDEIVILRRQKRSDYRKSGLGSPIATDLVAEVVARAVSVLDVFQETRPDLSMRIGGGKLIGHSRKRGK
jgi:hypothetical protein